MTQLPDSNSSGIRRFATMLVAGLTLFGCSAEGVPTPTRTATTPGESSVTAPAVSGKKTAKPGRVIQTPATAGYEDKPTSRVQGR
jgi:hypothetical protein